MSDLVNEDTQLEGYVIDQNSSQYIKDWVLKLTAGHMLEPMKEDGMHIIFNEYLDVPNIECDPLYFILRIKRKNFEKDFLVRYTEKVSNFFSALLRSNEALKYLEEAEIFEGIKEIILSKSVKKVTSEIFEEFSTSVEIPLWIEEKEDRRYIRVYDEWTKYQIVIFDYEPTAVLKITAPCEKLLEKAKTDGCVKPDNFNVNVSKVEGIFNGEDAFVFEIGLNQWRLG